MAEEQEVRATHEEVEGFVQKLQGFYGSLSESERAMLVTILEGAQAQDTGGYGFKFRRYGDPESQEERGDTEREGGQGWNDLVGWIEQQGEEDAQGFGLRFR